MGKREKALIFGADYPTRDGTCVRDYIHVTDLAQAHILALGALDGGSRFYNLGNGEGFTVKEVIDAARQITGKEIRAEIGPRRSGDPAVLVAASDKIRKELGWVPKFPHVRTIIESAWRWHEANPNGYSK
jgi:UDP-glucose 4-epimerase